MNPFFQIRSALTALLLFLLILGSPAVRAGAEFSSLELLAGFHRIEAEVASTQEARMQGLMQRTAMPPHHGMLFVFPSAERHCMWMKNTLIPLSVAFLDNDGRIINIRDMQPLTETSHCADAPAWFALEMNRGWFASRGIGPGLRLQGIENAPKPDQPKRK